MLQTTAAITLGCLQASVSPASDTIQPRKSGELEACLHHATGRNPPSTSRRGSPREAPVTPFGRPRRTPSPKCPTPASPWTCLAHSACRLSPPPDCVTRSSTFAPRCIASPPRSTSCGHGSAAAPPPLDGRHAASPGNLSAPGPVRRGHRAAGCLPAPAEADPSEAARPAQLPAAALGDPGGPPAPSVARGGQSPRASHGGQEPPPAGRAVDEDGYSP
jgi:hypothetical protein